MGGAAPESTEADLISSRVPFADLLARVLSGAITDSMTVAAALMVEVLRVKGGLPSPVAIALGSSG